MKIKIKKEMESVEKEPEKSPMSYAPTKEFLDSVWGEITRHGIKVMADGRQWVLHCISGEALPREGCDPFRNKNGNIMWKRKGEELSVLDELKHFIWKNPERSKL